MAESGEPRYKRVLLKLSGEALAGDRGFGIEPQVVDRLTDEIKAIAWKAQLRLHRRYQRLQARGKPRQYITTVVARELAGFLWAVGLEVEKQRAQKQAA